MPLASPALAVALTIVVVSTMPASARRSAAAAQANASARTTAQPDARNVHGRPKLAVLIVVDQMRADYVDRFKDQWNYGLKRLITQGAWFSNAAYPYLATLT